MTKSNSFLQRLIGAFALDSAIYEEVEADGSATAQALSVVLLASVATGVGSRGLADTTFQSIVFMTLAALIAWATWALVIFEIGARLLPQATTRVDVGELLRTMGFAAAPGTLNVLGLMSNATVPVFTITSLWMLAAMIVAVRQALDYTTTARAVAVCCLGWVLAFAIAAVIGLFFGPTLQ